MTMKIGDEDGSNKIFVSSEIEKLISKFKNNDQASFNKLSPGSSEMKVKIYF